MTLKRIRKRDYLPEIEGKKRGLLAAKALNFRMTMAPHSSL